MFVLYTILIINYLIRINVSKGYNKKDVND